MELCLSKSIYILDTALVEDSNATSFLELLLSSQEELLIPSCLLPEGMHIHI